MIFIKRPLLTFSISNITDSSMHITAMIPYEYIKIDSTVICKVLGFKFELSAYGKTDEDAIDNLIETIFTNIILLERAKLLNFLFKKTYVEEHKKNKKIRKWKYNIFKFTFNEIKYLKIDKQIKISSLETSE